MAKKKKATTEQIVTEVLDKAGLNWDVKKVPLVIPPITLEDGTQIASQPLGNTPSQARNYANYRTDDGSCVGVASENWNVIQNRELAEFMVTAGSNLLDAANYRGGSFDNGMRVYIQAELPSTYIGKSDINRHLTALNSHVRGQALGFGHCNEVVVCRNTFYAAMKSAGVERFSHQAGLRAQLAEAAQILATALEREEKLMELLTASAEVDYTEQAKAKMVNALFGYDVTSDHDGQVFDELSTQKRNKIVAFDDAVTTSMEEQGGTMYALFNGVTRYTNHQLEASEESLMRGSAHTINSKGVATLEQILQECGVAV